MLHLFAHAISEPYLLVKRQAYRCYTQSESLTSKGVFRTLSAVHAWVTGYGRLVLVYNAKIIQMPMAFVHSSVVRIPFLCAAF